jgi:hypothetical protein
LSFKLFNRRVFNMAMHDLLFHYIKEKWSKELELSLCNLR